MRSSCFLSKEKTWTQTVSIYQLVLTGVITSPANLALLMAFGWHTQKEHKDCKDHKAGRRDTIKLFSPKYVSLYHDRTTQTETLLYRQVRQREVCPHGSGPDSKAAASTEPFPCLLQALMYILKAICRGHSNLSSRGSK